MKPLKLPANLLSKNRLGGNLHDAPPAPPPAARDEIARENEVDVELTSALSIGGSATAKIRLWRGGALVTTSLEIVVIDTIGTMVGSIGDRGIAGLIHGSDPPRWRLKNLKC